VALIRTACLVAAVVILALSCSPGSEREGGVSPLDRQPTSLMELALHPNRWVRKRVVVEGQLYKFPGNRASSAKVQDQLVCDRIDRFPPGGRGTYCIVFWRVRVQDVPGARRSPDRDWWVRRRRSPRWEVARVPLSETSRRPRCPRRDEVAIDSTSLTLPATLPRTYTHIAADERELDYQELLK
jgi:hypothetical protein